MKTRRVLEFVVVPGLLLLGFVVPVVLWGDRLPDEVAVHWDLSGQPDRGDDVPAVLGTLVVLWLAFWAAWAGAVRGGKVGGSEARVLTASLYWLGGLLVTLWAIGLSASLDVDDWRRADPVHAWHLVVALVVALPVGAVGWLLGGGHPAVAHPRGRAVEPMTSPDGALVWSSRSTNRAMLLASLAPLGMGVALLPATEGALFVVAIAAPVTVLLATLTTKVTVTVGPHGLRSTMGWLGWPRKTVAIEDVTHVSVEDVVPLRYGGWGIRLGGGACAWIVRAGPGIRLGRRGASDFVVTVDGAEQGAAVLAGHLEGAPTR